MAFSRGTKLEDRQYCKSAQIATISTPKRGEGKIYDLMMLNSELDWLEVRFNELHNHVDYFCRPRKRHDPSPVSRNPSFSKRTGPIREIPPSDHPSHSREPPTSTRRLPRERLDPRNAHQRNAMFDQVFPKLEGGDQAAHRGDVILVSDVDEIPRPATMTLLRNCQFPQRLTLRSDFYYYSFQWRHVGVQWGHPEADLLHRSRDDDPAGRTPRAVEGEAGPVECGVALQQLFRGRSRRC